MISRFIDKKDWNPYVVYENTGHTIDTANFNGYTYYCKRTHTNQMPTDAADNIYWGLLSENEDGILNAMRKDMERMRRMIYNINRSVRSGFEDLDDRLEDLEKKLSPSSNETEQ